MIRMLQVKGGETMTSATINEAMLFMRTMSYPTEIQARKITIAYHFFKRVSDIGISSLAILGLSGLFIILTVITTIVTRGHPFFADVRVGRNGRDIKVYKFRTMYYDAEENIDKYLDHSQKKQWKKERKVDNDPRVTKFGNVLRKTSLDELPQLFNILLGSMSLVGVRPMTRKEIQDNYTLEQTQLIYGSKPGLTGVWQVLGRNDIDFESGKRQKLDMLYFKNRGFRYETKLVFLTVPAVLTQKGAR